MSTLIGQSILRREDLRFLTGAGRFTDDLNLAGQAFASFVRSPHAHADIPTLDTGAARTAPGATQVAGSIGDTHSGVVTHSALGSGRFP